MHPKRSVPAWYDIAFARFLYILFLVTIGLVSYVVFLAQGCMDALSSRPIPSEIREAFSLSMIFVQLTLISIRIDSGNMPGRAPLSRYDDIELLKAMTALAAVTVFMGYVMDKC